MFAKIFKFEISYWLKSPLFYVYMLLMLALSTISMAAALGVFDSNTFSVVGIKKANSASAINGLLSAFTLLTYFLIPSIIGSSIYRDYKSEMYHVLFSYPFTKSQYLLAKFSSSFLITLMVIFCGVLGLMLGCYLPGANPDLLLDFDLANFIQPFLLIVIPNIFFFGTVIFGVVTFSRNIFVGFVVVLILLVLQGLANSYMSDLDTKTIAALLDPMGASALSYETEYWTVAEQNKNLLPFSGYVLYNRILWASVSLLLFFGIFKAFKFNQSPINLNPFKRKGQRHVKRNFGGNLIKKPPQIKLNLSNFQLLKNVWKYAGFELKYILKNWAFISIFLVAMVVFCLTLNVGYKIQGTETLPVTRIMIALGGQSVGLFMMVLVFLFSGMLIHRGRIANMDQLIDTTVQPTWVFIASKFLAILAMIGLIYLSIILISIIYQTTQGFYDFEVGLYFYRYFLVGLLNWIILTFLAFFFHSLIKNYIVGFVSLLAFTILLNFFSSFGIEQSIFVFNRISGVSYSDMNGFGAKLPLFYIYKIYWGLFGMALLIIAALFYRRGLTIGISERFKLAKMRFSTNLKIGLSLCLLLFLGLGSYIYYVDNIKNERFSGKERELKRVNYEKEYSDYNQMDKLRITKTKIDLALFPKTRDYKVEGIFTLKNKTQTPIDSVFLNTSDDLIDYNFSTPTEVSLENDRYDFKVLRFKKSIEPGEELAFNFTMKNEPNSWFYNHSPVKNNGTFLNNNMFPSFGYSERYEIQSDKIREKHGLRKKESMKSPNDSTALGNTYISNEADWIDFEATISTSPEQTAIAPGYLQKEWTEDGRRYFHYEMEDKMLNFYNIMSAEYKLKQEKFEGINLQIFHHPSHTYNLDRMMDGLKSSLAYYQENFSPYQFRQLRIMEFPSTYGSFAQSFANTVPFSEGIGFIANVNDKNDGVDYPFTVTAHEVAHQWWAHQVIGADVQGSTLMSESLSEYSALKVLEERYGKKKMRRFLKEALDGYLQGRRYEDQTERSLIYNENKQYIHYNKGSLVLYALSDYLGTKKFNTMLSNYIDDVAFQEPPYTTSIEFTEHVEKATPDSLRYLVHDMLENIILYDNKVLNYDVEPLDNGKYEVSITAQVSKYRTEGYGKRHYETYDNCSLSYPPESVDESLPRVESLPLRDYVEVGVFAQDADGQEEILYLKKRKITEIHNKFTITVDKKPTAVGIDPYNKLIDRNSTDNRKQVED